MSSVMWLKLIYDFEKYKSNDFLGVRDFDSNKSKIVIKIGGFIFDNNRAIGTGNYPNQLDFLLLLTNQTIARIGIKTGV